jgi:hypothetical protein
VLHLQNGIDLKDLSFFLVGIVKINGVPQGVDPRICTIPKETEVGNIFDENDLETQDIPTSPKMQILIWRWAYISNF